VIWVPPSIVLGPLPRKRISFCIFSALLGLLSIAGMCSTVVTAQAQATVDIKQIVRDRNASARSHTYLESQGFRYMGTGGHPPFVYYVYQRPTDGLEYHCLQKAWSTGSCYPNPRRDPNVLPRYVRIPDLKRASYRYRGVRYAGSTGEHLYVKSCAHPAYLCPNEGSTICRAISAATGQC
jgi:hypothetical protein